MVPPRQVRSLENQKEREMRDRQRAESVAAKKQAAVLKQQLFQFDSFQGASAPPPSAAIPSSHNSGTVSVAVPGQRMMSNIAGGAQLNGASISNLGGAVYPPRIGGASAFPPSAYQSVNAGNINGALPRGVGGGGANNAGKY